MGIFKNLFLKDKKKAEEAALPKESFGDKAHVKLNKLTQFALDIYEDVLEEFEILKHKISNLCETNYNLGLRLLERGHVYEACRRFWFTKKFWPKCYDAYYQHAYTLMLTKRPNQAKKVLKHLLNIYPNYDTKALDLLNNIENESKPND